MTFLQQLRIWLPKASAAERATAALAVAIVLVLLGYLIPPVTGGSGSSSLKAGNGFPGTSTTGTTGGSTGGATGGSAVGTAGTTGGATGTTGALTLTTGSSGTVPSSSGGTTTGSGSTGGTSGSGSAGGTSGATSGSTTGAKTSCPAAGSGQGVTDTEIKVAVTIVSLAGAGGNALVNVPSPAEQQGDYRIVADTINRAGGAGCRKLALTFYTVNPLDPSNTQSQCQAIADSKPFAVIDLGALTDVGASDCIPQQKIPLISQFVTLDQAKAYYPYYVNPLSLAEDNFKNGYRAASKQGFFSPASGFKKLGIVYQSCRPSIVKAARDAIHASGIPDSAVVTYNLGCPPERQNTAADFQQAVLNFQRAGVTHVTETDASGWAGFTQAAGQQKYKPKYVFAEDAAAGDMSGTNAPDASNFDGAIDIVGRRLGESHTPGYKPAPATAKCDAIYAKNGQPATYKQGAGYGGVVCNMLWFVTGVANHASVLQRTAIAPSMRAFGHLDASFPWGPVDYASLPAGTPYGKEQWRIDQFHGDCGCWQVKDPTFHAPLA